MSSRKVLGQKLLKKKFSTEDSGAKIREEILQKKFFKKKKILSRKC